MSTRGHPVTEPLKATNWGAPLAPDIYPRGRQDAGIPRWRQKAASARRGKASTT